MVEDPREDLQEVLKLERENNKMLHAMRRGQRWHTVVMVIYWLVILGGMVTAYHYLEPYLRTLIETYNSIQDGIGKISSFGS